MTTTATAAALRAWAGVSLADVALKQGIAPQDIVAVDGKHVPGRNPSGLAPHPTRHHVDHYA